MEVHSAPGPPRTSIVMDRGRRVAVLEVRPDRGAGSIELADRSRYVLERLPCGDRAGAWWVTGPDGREVGSLVPRAPIGERFLVRLTDLELEVVPVGSIWRRRWDVVDVERRAIVEVVQRPWSRPVHDVDIRAGDVPFGLSLLVAWTLALATTPPVAATRHPRWTSDHS